MAKHSPAFQLYVGDFRQDPNTIVMSTLEIGAYWLLIMECWDRGNALPKDMEFLSHIARMTVKRFEPLWTAKIKRCFVYDKTRKVFWHKRLAKEIDKQIEWSKKKSKAGKLGADKRWGINDLENGDAIATPSTAIAQDSSLSLSLSLSSSEDLKRLIDACVRENPKKDPRLIEIGVIQTIISRNGSTDPINSIRYFDPEINRLSSKAGEISKGMIDGILQRRREQIAATLKP